MKRFTLSLFLLIMLFAGSQVKAQQTQIYLNLSGALPTGSFAEGDETEFALFQNSNDKEAGAGFGFNLGLKFKIATGVTGLRALITVDGIYNGLNAELREYFEDQREKYEDLYDEYELTTAKYINAPVMAGINYTYDLNNKVGLFAEAGVGANVRFITKFETTTEKSSLKTTNTIEFEPKAMFAYQLGGGIELSKKYTLGLNFYNLGTAKAKANTKRKVTNLEPVKDDYSTKRITSTVLMLRFGIKL